MKQELKRLVRLAGCGALLCGGVVLAQDAAPAPAAPAAAAPAKREGNPAFKELRTQIEAKEKAALEKNAELKTAVEALDAQIKAKREERTPEARNQAREISKQRQEKFAAVDPELKDLYAKLNDLMRQQFGNRGGAKPAEAAKPGEAKPEVKPEAKPANQ